MTLSTVTPAVAPAPVTSPELAALREEIRRTETYLGSARFYSAPWEHQHNVMNSLAYLRAKEARLSAELAADEERTADLLARAEATGQPVLAALLYVPFGADAFTALTEPAAEVEPAAVETPAATAPAPVEPAYIPTRTGYRAANTFPKTLTIARQRLQTADDAFWAHSDHCDPCADAAWGDTREWTMCGTGKPLWEAWREAQYNVDNWRQLDAWHNRGGYERALENDWIAS